MKNLLLTLVFTLVSAIGFAQSADGKEEYDKALVALGKGQGKKANQLLEQSYRKGYEQACIKIQTTAWGSDYQRLEARKTAAEKGNPEFMFHYGVENIDNREGIINSTVLKPLGTPSLNEAFEYVVKAAKTGYQPAYFYLGKKLEEKGDTRLAIIMYQYLADSGNKEGMYKLAILKKDAKAAFEAAINVGDPDGDAIHESAMLSKDPKYVFEVAKIYTERNTDSKNSYDKKRLYGYRLTDLYHHACDLGSGEGCYRTGLHYLADYTGRYYGVPYFEKAIKLGFKVPEDELLKMKSQPTPEEVKKMEEQLQVESERAARWADSHPSEDQIKEDLAGNNTKSSLSQADMDNIIKANFPASSSEDDRHRREMEKQARDTEKVTNGTWNGR